MQRARYKRDHTLIEKQRMQNILLLIWHTCILLLIWTLPLIEKQQMQDIPSQTSFSKEQRRRIKEKKIPIKEQKRPMEGITSEDVLHVGLEEKSLIWCFYTVHFDKCIWALTFENVICVGCSGLHAHTHTHTHTYIYHDVYMYICIYLSIYL